MITPPPKTPIFILRKSLFVFPRKGFVEISGENVILTKEDGELVISTKADDLTWIPSESVFIVSTSKEDTWAFIDWRRKIKFTYANPAQGTGIRALAVLGVLIIAFSTSLPVLVILIALPLFTGLGKGKLSTPESRAMVKYMTANYKRLMAEGI